jgi:hypothetical protein
MPPSRTIALIGYLGTVGLAVAQVIAVSQIAAGAQTIHGRDGIVLPEPPAVEAHPVSDDYFGTKIPDSYRWLEDAKSPETRAFIDAENAYTTRYLKQAKIRGQILDDLDTLEKVSEMGTPAAVLHLCAAGCGGFGSFGVRPVEYGAGQAARRSSAADAGRKHFGWHGRCFARWVAVGLLGARGRRGRVKRSYSECEDQQNAGR